GVKRAQALEISDDTQRAHASPLPFTVAAVVVAASSDACTRSDASIAATAARHDCHSPCANDPVISNNTGRTTFANATSVTAMSRTTSTNCFFATLAGTWRRTDDSSSTRGPTAPGG